MGKKKESSMTQYTIAGGGVAGVTAAREIKKLDPDAVIDIYSSESVPII